MSHWQVRLTRFCDRTLLICTLVYYYCTDFSFQIFSCSNCAIEKRTFVRLRQTIVTVHSWLGGRQPEVRKLIWIQSSFRVDFLLTGGTFSADAGDDLHDSMIYDFVYMKVAFEAGLRRETIHGRAFSEIVSMRITLRNWIQERNYTWKDFFGNRVYENRNQMLIFTVKRRLNIHDFRMRTSMSILPVDFQFQAGNPYTRFSKKASHVQSLLFGQGDVFILVWFFMRRLCRASLFVCLRTPFDRLYLFAYRSRPVQTKKSTIFSLRADAALEYCSIFRRLSSAARKFLLANRVK